MANQTDLMNYQHSPLSERWQYAKALAEAGDLIPRGLFDKATGHPSVGKIFLVMETGSMLGLAPMAAIAGIDVIEGKAAITPRVALGLFRARGHKVRIIETGTVATGDFKVTVRLERTDDPDEPIEASWTIDQSVQAELVDSYNLNVDTGKWIVKARTDKGIALPWEKYTEDMCLWRATGRLMRRGGQDVLMGIGYIPEELEALVNDEGVRVGEDTATVQALITQIQAADDRAILATIWKENHEGDSWVDRVQGEFDTRAAIVQKDSRVKQDGRPGSTGIREIDAAAPTPAATVEAPESDQGQAEVDSPDEPENDDEDTADGEMTPEEWDEHERAEYSKFLDSQKEGQLGS